MKILDALKPTAPKIILYIGLFFVSPTFFTVCNETCSYSFKFLSGWMLAKGTAPTLTLPMLLLLFAISYLAASAIIAIFNYAKEKKMMLE